ncbi:hypothetical protein [Tolypothrix sp. VBCCA 56010]|uniref:hypothetical protein n=1 Tax=Tolypothrix sp. VBCCA 56010 TaxID=3137731 RepID=UPI003D7E6EE4
MMLKNSQITAFALTLTSLFVAITTNVADAGQTTEGAASIINQSGQGNPEPLEKPCNKPKICPICTGSGCVFPPQRPPIPITRSELNEVTNAVAIEKLEALKASGQATNDDYILLGYFYSLEKKYDKSEANYLTALKLATDDGRKAIIEQELKKVRDVMREPQLGGETKP